MITTGDWRWETRRGTAAELHVPAPPTRHRRTACLMEVDGTAFVLGSGQPESDVDEASARDLGISWVRRRSGGGAVLLVPGDHVWIDLWLPAGDDLWIDDVGRAADWLAEVWIAALSEVGVADLAAHRGAMVETEWSRQVCFAGLGSGEVTAGGRKLVGVSQRRTREWARFQCLVHRQWDAATSFGLLAAPGAAAAGEVWRERVATIGGAPVVAAVATALESAPPTRTALVET